MKMRTLGDNPIKHALGEQTPRSKVYTQQELIDLIEKAERNKPRNESKGDKPKPDGQDSDQDQSDNLVQPITFEKAFFLSGDFGKRVDKEVHNRYSGINAITEIKYDNSKNVVQGSNSFYCVAVNEVLRAQFPEIRTANQAELEFIAQNDSKHPLHLKGNHYEDSSLVWRSDSEPNAYLASKLSDQFRQKGKPLQSDHAYVLPLHTLSLAKDSSSKHKLIFSLTDETLNEYFEAQVLMSKSGLYIDSSNMNRKTGLPNQVTIKDLTKENRQLYTRNSGLSRLYLYWGLYLNSNFEDLAYSDDGGRVVLVCSEAAAKKYDLGGKK